MRRFLLALALSSLSFSTAAFAEHGGTPGEQRACSRDVLACLKENRQKLSAGCSEVLKSHGQ
jgi:hypothetical protein